MDQPLTLLLKDIPAHLSSIENDAAIPLDTGLLEQGELLTNRPDYQSGEWKETKPLFQQIASLLPTLQEDPQPLIRFVAKLTHPYHFEDVKDLDFDIGLDLQAIPFHSLLLTLLHKTTASSTDAQTLANRPTVCAALVRLWLCTASEGIATQAEELILALLKVSKNESPGPIAGVPVHEYGAGSMWRRLFNDRDVYSLFFQYTCLKTEAAPFLVPPSPVLRPREKTIAQARLLHWLPAVGAMDWNTITEGRGFEVERDAGLAPGEGLLDYAALKMVDIEEDILMHVTLVNSYCSLLDTVGTTSHALPRGSSLSLEYLQDKGIHQNIVNSLLTDDRPWQYALLAPHTSRYICDYARSYPEHFEKSPNLDPIRGYLQRHIGKCEPHELHLAVSMPRATLIPRSSQGFQWQDCVLLEISLTRATPAGLRALGTVFRGPTENDITFPPAQATGQQSRRSDTEGYFARLLTYLFYQKNKNMFADLVSHAETMALVDKALAALSTITSFITSTWATTRPSEYDSDTDSFFAELKIFPKSGLDLILNPAFSGGLLPMLLRPATSYSNLVGGRGDAENAAYQVAVAKFEVLKLLSRRLEASRDRADVLALVRRRVGEGLWGSGGGVGSRIGTLEL